MQQLKGAQLWVRYINDRGGLNGHPVKLAVFDDGGDPARHRSQVQEAVETRHAIAFLANAAAIAGHAGAAYLTAKRVPVVGVSGGDDYASPSPMYFPQMANAESWYRTMVPSIVTAATKGGKLGSIVCVEAPACDPADKAIAEQAKPNGFDHVYRARASIAQPDFTAECLAARNAGVQVFLVIEDQNTLGRLASSCKRQGFSPLYAIVAPATFDQQKDDPNLDGLVASSTVFPYFQSGTPATDEFQQAMRDYGKGLAPGNYVASGWTAGKLLEKAAAQLPEPPTTAAILAGLWTLKDETLGGLAPPLTFVTDQPAKPPACWFQLVVKNKAWTNPDQFRVKCV